MLRTLPGNLGDWTAPLPGELLSEARLRVALILGGDIYPTRPLRATLPFLEGEGFSDVTAKTATTALDQAMIIEVQR